MQRKTLAKMIDHTFLAADATENQIKNCCDIAKQYEVACVAVNPSTVKWCKEYLNGSSVKIDVAIAFPLGQLPLDVKLYEVESAIKNGADEIDYVINIGELKNGNYAYIEKEMTEINLLCKKHNKVCKVIFENCYLTQDEIINLSTIAKKVEPDFIKTSTGFGKSGAKVGDVQLMKKYAGDKVQVKAAGGIRDYETAIMMIKSGATRIGTSSSEKILDDIK